MLLAQTLFTHQGKTNNEQNFHENVATNDI